MSIHSRPPRSTSPKRWIEESWLIARQHAYPPAIDERWPEEGSASAIDDAFFENSRELANRRLVDAGYRIADVLNRAFRSTKPQRR